MRSKAGSAQGKRDPNEFYSLLIPTPSKLKEPYPRSNTPTHLSQSLGSIKSRYYHEGKQANLYEAFNQLLQFSLAPKIVSPYFALLTTVVPLSDIFSPQLDGNSTSNIRHSRRLLRNHIRHTFTDGPVKHLQKVPNGSALRNFYSEARRHPLNFREYFGVTRGIGQVNRRRTHWHTNAIPGDIENDITLCHLVKLLWSLHFPSLPKPQLDLGEILVIFC